jgi:hypothetical protein
LQPAHKDILMNVKLNQTIVAARDNWTSALFMTEILGLD